MGPFYEYVFKSIPAWKNNLLRGKCGMELFIHYKITPFKFWNREVISSHTSYGMELHIHAGIKVNPC